MLRARNFIIRYQTIRPYSLSYEEAEKIKSQLQYRDAKLLTPKNGDSSTEYKGIMLLACGPVMKYNSMKQFSTPYLEAGFAVINMNNGFVDFAFCRPADAKINNVLGLISDNISKPCPLVAKMYCSGTPTYLPSIIKKLSQPDCKLKLSGVIFDSSPPLSAAIDVIRASRFFEGQKRYPTVYHRIKEALIPYTCMLVNGVSKRNALDRITSTSSLFQSVPQLYVYSTTDICLDMSRLHKFIDKQCQRKADVTVHTFNDTLHMLHRLKYPKEYDNLLFNFLRTKCKLL